MKSQGEPCDRKGQARFNAEGSGVIQTFTLHSTNNRAERAIRPVVTCRKVSGGSRSGKGARDFATVYSVLESKRKKGKLPFRADPG